ncbi:MAG: major facilitator superfamily protein [Alphaproteobacteria bacterium]|nr:major facilitator superfamily protein [Alphaproteobacteria bacterium]
MATILILPPGTAPDAKRLLATRGIRAFGDGLASLLLPVYLRLLGYDAVEIGALATAALLGSAVIVWLSGLVAHHLGVRRFLLMATILPILTGIGFATQTEFWPLLLIAIIGTLTPTAGDVSLFLPLEQAALAGAVTPKSRTALFARYSIVGSLMAAFGSLAIGLPELLVRHTHVELAQALRWMFLLYAVLGLICAALYAGLEKPAVAVAPPRALGPSRGIVYRLTTLFAVDAFGSGFFVQSLFALWLLDRFQLDPTTAGAIFFWAGLAAAISFLAASALSARIGLINTMVFTHIPANLCLIALPFAPTLEIAIALIIVRGLLSQMDVPTRTSYVMAVVTPEERPAAAAFTAIPRSLATAIAPVLSGWMLMLSGFGWPLVIGGAIKIAYDFGLLALFRKVKPPEEN